MSQFSYLPKRGRAFVLVVCLGLLNAACLVREPVLFEPPELTSEAQISRRWHANGVRSLEEQLVVWSDGRLERDGYSRAWYASGGLTYERFYRGDQGVKLWRSWYESGALKSELDLADGHSLAPMRFYYESGQLSAEGNGIGGSRHGLWSYWYPNGQLSAQGEYEDMQKQGPWTYWDEAGNECARDARALRE